MPKLRVFVLPCLLGFALGAVVGVYTSTAIMLAVLVGGLCLLLLRRALRGNYPLTTVIIVAIMCFALGLLRGGERRERMEASVFRDQIGKTITLLGVVSTEPQLRAGRQRLTISPDPARGSEDILVTLPRHPEFAYGAHLRVTGMLTQPQDFLTDAGTVFRYADFLHARGTMLILEHARAASVGDAKGNGVVAQLLAFKRAILQVVAQLPAPESGLLMGMIFGGKEGLPDHVQNDFRIAGLLHIIVLSGENLTIIALLVTLFVRKFFGFISGLIFSSVVIVAYAIIGGLEPATLRALVVVLLLFTSFLLRREASLPRVVLISALVLVSLNPLLLFDDPSFQLSMLAILGLLFIGPVIERRLLLSDLSPMLVGYLAPILGAQLGVLPYIVWQSQSIALYALLANLLVLFFIAFLSIGGIILVAIGMLLPSLFSLVAFPVVLALTMVIAIAHTIAGLPGASVAFALPGWVATSIYALLCIWLYRKWRTVEMSPLARFTLREEVKQLAKRKIPWVAPLPESQGIRLDGDTLEFSFKGNDQTRVERIGVIDWSDH